MFGVGRVLCRLGGGAMSIGTAIALNVSAFVLGYVWGALAKFLHNFFNGQ